MEGKRDGGERDSKRESKTQRGEKITGMLRERYKGGKGRKKARMKVNRWRKKSGSKEKKEGIRGSGKQENTWRNEEKKYL